MSGILDQQIPPSLKGNAHCMVFELEEIQSILKYPFLIWSCVHDYIFQFPLWSGENKRHKKLFTQVHIKSLFQNWKIMEEDSSVDIQGPEQLKASAL